MDDAALTETLCALLGEVPGWSWRTSDTYSPDEVGVFYGAIPPTPDAAVGVRVYGADDDLVTGVAYRRAQIRFRGAKGDPRGADVMAAQAFAALQGLSRTGGMSGVNRLSVAPLGADTNGREERTDNYSVLLELTPEVTP